MDNKIITSNDTGLVIKKATRMIIDVESLLCEVYGLFIKPGIQERGAAFNECMEIGESSLGFQWISQKIPGNVKTLLLRGMFKKIPGNILRSLLFWGKAQRNSGKYPGKKLEESTVTEKTKTSGGNKPKQFIVSV